MHFKDPFSNDTTLLLQHLEIVGKISVSQYANLKILFTIFVVNLSGSIWRNYFKHEVGDLV